MELSWELEQLGRAATPDVVLDGRRLVDRVSDVIRQDDGWVDAIVRGEPAHMVSIAAGFPHSQASLYRGEQCAALFELTAGLRGNQLAELLRDTVARPLPVPR